MDGKMVIGRGCRLGNIVLLALWSWRFGNEELSHGFTVPCRRLAGGARAAEGPGVFLVHRQCLGEGLHWTGISQDHLIGLEDTVGGLHQGSGASTGEVAHQNDSLRFLLSEIEGKQQVGDCVGSLMQSLGEETDRLVGHLSPVLPVADH